MWEVSGRLFSRRISHELVLPISRFRPRSQANWAPKVCPEVDEAKKSQKKSILSFQFRKLICLFIPGRRIGGYFVRESDFSFSLSPLIIMGKYSGMPFFSSSFFAFFLSFCGSGEQIATAAVSQTKKKKKKVREFFAIDISSLCATVAWKPSKRFAKCRFPY